MREENKEKIRYYNIFSVSNQAGFQIMFIMPTASQYFPLKKYSNTT